MLCISCILGDKAKQYDLISLDDGLVIEQQVLRSQEDTLQSEIGVLKSATLHIEEYLADIDLKLGDKVNQVSLFFKELVRRIEKRQDDVLAKYQLESETEKVRALTYKSSIEHRLGAVEESLELLREISSVRDKFILLSQTKKVGEALSELKPFKPEKFSMQIREFRPEVELRAVLQDSHDLFSTFSPQNPNQAVANGSFSNAPGQLHQRINQNLKQPIPANKTGKDVKDFKNVKKGNPGNDSTSNLNFGSSQINQTVDGTRDGHTFNSGAITPNQSLPNKNNASPHMQSQHQLRTNPGETSISSGIPVSLNTSKDMSLLSCGPGNQGMVSSSLVNTSKQSNGMLGQSVINTPSNVMPASTSRQMGRGADGSRDKKSRGGNAAQSQAAGKSVQLKGNKPTKENVSPLPPQKGAVATPGVKAGDNGNKSAAVGQNKKAGPQHSSRGHEDDKLAQSRLMQAKQGSKVQENPQPKQFSDFINGVDSVALLEKLPTKEDEEVIVPVLNFDTCESPSPIQQQLLAGSLNLANTSQLYKMPGKKGASSELERARALKKAALKMQTSGPSEVIGTPTKLVGFTESSDSMEGGKAGKTETQVPEGATVPTSHRKLTPLIGVNSDSKSGSKTMGKKGQIENSAGLMTLTSTKAESLELPNLTPASVLVIGGYGSDPETELPMQRFVYSTQQWEQLPDKVCQVKSASVRVSSSKVWLIGGKAKGQRLATITEIDLTTGKATVLGTTLAKAKSGAGVAYLDGFVYVIGGNSGESILSEMEIINVNTLEVKKGPSMNSRRDEMGVTVGDDGNVYAFGGYGGNNHDFLSTCERFNPKKNRWEMISSMKKARRSFCCVTAPDGIYCIAGFDGKSYISAVER